MWLKPGGLLIIGRTFFQISPVLFQKSQVNVCLRVFGIRSEGMSEICNRLLCLLLVCPDLPQPVQRMSKIALDGQRARKIFHRLVNSPLKNQQIANIIILRGYLWQQFADALSFFGGLRQFCPSCQILRKIEM